MSGRSEDSSAGIWHEELLCRSVSSVVKTKNGDGVRHNRLRLPQLQADNSYKIERICRRFHVKDFLAISIAAVLGANLRYLLSRLAAREFGLIFPYGTL